MMMMMMMMMMRLNADNMALPTFPCHAAVHHAAIDQYLLLAGLTAANLQ